MTDGNSLIQWKTFLTEQAAIAFVDQNPGWAYGEGHTLSVDGSRKAKCWVAISDPETDDSQSFSE